MRGLDTGRVVALYAVSLVLAGGASLAQSTPLHPAPSHPSHKHYAEPEAGAGAAARTGGSRHGSRTSARTSSR